MKKQFRLAVFVVIAVSIVGLSFLAIRSYMARSRNRVSFSGDKNIDVKIDNVHYANSRLGRVEWELDAKSAARFKKGGVMKLDAVKMIFHAKDGEDYVLTAGEALYDEAAGVVDAMGGVSVKSKKSRHKGFTMTTDKIRYHAKSRKVASDEPVRIISDGMLITGTGLVVDLDGGKLNILKNVKAVLTGDAV